MNKTLEQINRFIHEAMDEKNCYHYWEKEGEDSYCVALSCHRCESKITINKPQVLNIPHNPNYLEHNSDWTKMVNWAKEESWWDDFIMIDIYECDQYGSYPVGAREYRSDIVDLFADPPALATAITEYLEGRDV